jgi:hypothetical protein
MGTNCFIRPLKSKAISLPDFMSSEASMKKFVPTTSVFLLFLAVAACAPATPAVKTEPPTQQVAPGEPYHPLTSQTGIQTIDQVLQAVAGGDSDALHPLIEFIDAVCTHQDGLGGPPKCRQGEVEGTPVEVLAFLSSEGSYLRRQEIDQWTGVEAAGVYAVYDVNEAAVSSEEYFPVVNYVILLVHGENQAATALRIGEIGIVRVDTIGDSSPTNLNAMIEREASVVLLAPKS